jgi:hypothetical protein
MGASDQLHAPPFALLPRRAPGTHFTESWVDHRASLDGYEKIFYPPPAFEHRTIQPVANRYTDWAIPAPESNNV